MEYFGYLSSLFVLFGMSQLLSASSIEDKFEPMVAFICGRPAMHRGVNGWMADKSQNCPDTLEDVLSFCQKSYPDHNITNVVESSRLYDIPNWPMGNAERQHTHHIRPFRCLVGKFQSDALLVPQHCEFDHRHDITQCKAFSHWNRVADEACDKKGMHLESFGMLLYCRTLGHFNGVEYVCCPNPTETHVLPEPVGDDKPDQWMKEPTEGGDSSTHTQDEEEVSPAAAATEVKDTPAVAAASSSLPDEEVADLYEAYLRGLPFPTKYDNEHKKFLAAKDRMRKNQKKRVSKLLQQWEKERERVNEIKKTDPKAADKMNQEIAARFKQLYNSFKQEDEAETQQLLALHQQHIQASLNEHKREAMDKYMRALEAGESAKITHYLHNYIKAEEKDRMHTVNHFEHLRYSSPKEALRIHQHIINHLKLSELRIDQAMEMLTHYPEIEVKVRPEVEEFLKRFNAIATSIKDVVLPVPQVEEEEEEDSDASHESDEDIELSTAPEFDSSRQVASSSSSDSVSEEGVSQETHDAGYNSQFITDDEVQEDEHSYERSKPQHHFEANAMSNMQSADQGLKSVAKAGSQVGSSVGIALGSVSVFVIIVVAVMMIHRNRSNSRQSVSHGYVEVDPSASPEERHLANMQMNGYENPTYKYFEVQNNPKA